MHYSKQNYYYNYYYYYYYYYCLFVELEEKFYKKCPLQLQLANLELVT